MCSVNLKKKKRKENEAEDGFGLHDKIMSTLKNANIRGLVSCGEGKKSLVVIVGNDQMRQKCD